jgi:hypothetical protein
MARLVGTWKLPPGTAGDNPLRVPGVRIRSTPAGLSVQLSKDTTAVGPASSWTVTAATGCKLHGTSHLYLDPAFAYITFALPGDAQLYAIEQSVWAAFFTGTDALPLAWVDAHDALTPRLSFAAAGKCLGFSPTIQLVAGGNAWGVTTDTTAGTVDGALGTNMLRAPTGGVFGPDDKLYFIDAGTNFIRYYDPATGTVGTTVVSLDRGPTYTSPSPVFAIGPDGMFYMFLRIAADTDRQQIISVKPDNTSGPTIYTNDPVTPILADVANMYVAPDNSYVYVPCPKFGYQNSAYAAQPYTVAAIQIGSANVGHRFAGDTFIPSLQLGTANSQGEDVAALSGEVGNSLNCYCPPNGDLYTICNRTRMIRKISKTTGHIRSITNHVPLNSSGFTQAGGYGGDGLAAFTLNNNTPQLGQFGINSVTVDTCGNVFINDLQQGTGGFIGSCALVRYVDTSGTMHTLAGQYVDTANNMPTSTPAPALTKTIYNAQWIAWNHKEGALYVMCSAGTDSANYSANCIYRIASSN